MAYFHSLGQKNQFFQSRTIETIKEFDKIYEQYSNETGRLFRGMNEAKFMLYSSLQRNWISSNFETNEIELATFLRILVDNARKHESDLIINQLKDKNINSINDISVLSILQHYRCPTPLLDWTYNFKVALFFALENLNHPKSKFNNIDNYFSLYHIEESRFQAGELREIIMLSNRQNFEIYKQVLIAFGVKQGKNGTQLEKELTPQKVEQIVLNNYGKSFVQHMCNMNQMINIPVTYFSEIDNHSIKFGMKNNPNIVNQEGVFTWNSHPFFPLQYAAEVQYMKAEEVDAYYLSSCFNFNKTLALHIRQRLDQNKINASFIYPESNKNELEQLANDVWKKTLDVFKLN